MARPPFPNEHQYSLEQEVLRHDDAVISLGEMSACALLWAVADFEAGLVTRCSVCYLPYGDIAAAYEQPAKNRCTNCYGTSFEGGLRALLYRPALWNEDQVSEDNKERGNVTVSSGSVQVTSDFSMRDGDFIIRQDGTRWRISQPNANTIVHGFGPTGLQTSSGSMFRVQYEDPTSVAYTIPVTQLALNQRGWSPYMLYASSYDVVNGPLFVYTFDSGN